MATANQIIGNKPSTRDSAFIQLGTNDAMRTCTFNKLTKPFWIREIGAILGRAGATGCDYRLVFYLCTSGGTPQSRAAYVGIRTVNTVMTDKDGGAVVQYQLSVSDTGPHASKGALLPANTYWALGYELDAGGPMGHGYQPYTDTMDNKSFYDITGVNVPPTTYPSTYNRYTIGHMSVWALADQNEVPLVPTNRSPAGVITTLTPTFSSLFRDYNGRYRPSTDAGDVVSKAEIELVDAASGAVIWNPVWSTNSTEQANDAPSRLYNGPALVRGRAYSWRTRHMDSAGEWGDFSAPLALQVSLDSYVTLTGPSGRLDTLQPAITGSWTSLSGLAAKTVHVLIKEGANVVADSGNKAFAVAAGANFSLPWGTLGITDLEWGHVYTAQVQMQDSANAWSGYATSPSFKTNAPPSPPTNLSPSGSSVWTVAPTLSCSCTDPDAENPSSSLTVKAKIFDAATGVQSGATLTMAYNPSTNKFEVASGLTIKKSYYWQAYSWDGWLYSGATKTEANAALSTPLAYFDFLTGPVVTITAPLNGATITSNTTALTWTCPTQSRAEVWLEIAGKNVSGVIPLAGTTAIWVPPALAKRGQVITYHLTCWDASNLFMSVTTTVTLTYTPTAAPTNVTATPYRIGTEAQATAIWLAWDQSIDPNFRAYVLYRDDNPDVPLARIENVAQTVVVDYAAKSGVTHTYSLFMLSAVGNDTRTSLAATAAASVTFDGVVLYAEGDPEGTRFSARAWTDRAATSDGGDLPLKTWGSDAPITIRDTPGLWYSSTVTLPLWDDAESLGRVKRDKLMALAALGGPLVLKTGYGTARRVSIPAAGGIGLTDDRQGKISAALQLRDEATGVWPT